jgi:hypothetical protein
MPNKETIETQTPRQRSKAGRTLLIKPTGSFDESLLKDLAGCTATHHTEKSNSYFLTFTTPTDALNALKQIKHKATSKVLIKFAKYQIFFKIEGLKDDSDYNTVKSTHMKQITDLGGSVLYYRLYRKDNHYIGCGDFTIDTKECFDKLVNQDSEFKKFNLENNISGIYYRYKKTDGDHHHKKDEQ